MIGGGAALTRQVPCAPFGRAPRPHTHIRRRWLKRVLLLLIVVVALGAGAWWFFGRSKADAATFRTAEVRRGDLVSTISATGTVEPEELIDIGAQVAGRIIKFGVDTDGKPVDYGSHVNEG